MSLNEICNEMASTGLQDLSHIKFPLEVLDKIFEYLSTENLKNCRLVCSNWNTDACRAILLKTRIYIFTRDGFLPPYTRKSFYNVASIKQNFEIFLRNYQHLITDIVFAITEQDVSGLFNMLPKLPKLKALRIVFKSNHSYQLSSYGMEPLTSVVHLSIEIDSFFCDAGFIMKIENILERLFLLLPNLEVISFDEKYNRFGNQILKSIIESTSSLQKLQELDFSIKLTSFIKDLMQKKLPIRKLTLTVCSSNDIQSICDVLDHFSPTLATLTIRGATHMKDAGDPVGRCAYESPDVGVPTTEQILTKNICEKLNHLTELQFIWMKGSLDFIHSFQKLNCLKLNQFNFGNQMMHNNFNQMEHLETLIINCVAVPTCTLSFMQGFLKQFPNVKHLEMNNMRNLPLPFVLKNFVKLQKLHLTGPRLNDSEIVGTRSTDDAPIANLKDLKDLALTSDTITNHSIRYGLMKCNKLENVKIDSSHITFDEVMKLADVAPIKTLNISEYVDIESLLLMITAGSSAKEIMINGWNVVRNKNYDYTEVDTICKKINADYEQERQRRIMASRRNYNNDYEDDDEDDQEWQKWENAEKFEYKRNFNAPFLN